MGVSGVTTKDKEPITFSTPISEPKTSSPPKQKPLAIDLDAQPATTGPSSIKEFTPADPSKAVSKAK